MFAIMEFRRDGSHVISPAYDYAETKWMLRSMGPLQKFEFLIYVG